MLTNCLGIVFIDRGAWHVNHLEQNVEANETAIAQDLKLRRLGYFPPGLAK